MTVAFVRPILAAGLLLVAACGAQQHSRYSPPPGGATEEVPPWQGSQAQESTDFGAMCPAALPQTRIEVFDTADGAAIDFTTTAEGSLPDLERRVSAMAQHLNQQGIGSMPAGPGSAPLPGSDAPPPATDDSELPGSDDAQVPGASGSSGSGDAQLPDSQAESGSASPEAGSSQSTSPGTGSSGSMGSGATGLSKPVIRTSAYPVPNGSRLVFTAMNVSELEVVRTWVRDMAEQMRTTGSCTHLQGSQR